MKNTLMIVPCITLIICLGCVTKPIDISCVRTDEELDKYLGKRVTFTGKWQESKDGGISNGHVFISPDLAFWEGSHSCDFDDIETVTGYLTKYNYSGLPFSPPGQLPSQKPS